MADSEVSASAMKYERSITNLQDIKLQLRLFVAGNTPRSNAAIYRMHQYCEEYLAGNYILDVIDIYQQPEVARQEQIIATPTLVKYYPDPRRVFVGDLSTNPRISSQLGFASP